MLAYCPVCGREFIKSYPWQIYDRKQCKRKVNNKSYYKRHKPEIIKRVIQQQRKSK